MSSQVLSAQVYSPSAEAFVRLLRAHAATTRALSAELVKEHGLTINAYEAMLRLSRADGVTRLLDGLERIGYVGKARCESDARVTYAVLTDAGREKLRDASRSHLAAIGEIFEPRFEPEELETLAEFLDRLPSEPLPCDVPGDDQA
jgi:DNA-binding MarR family transcriptional regulator